MNDSADWITNAVRDEAERGYRAYRDSEDGATAEFVAAVPPHQSPEFHLAPLGLYLEWLRGYLAADGAPTHYYDYGYSSRFHVVTGDFTTGGECGAFARAVLVPSGVRHLGGAVGHNDLFFFDGFQASCWVPIYSDAEFLSLPNIVGFIEEQKAAHTTFWAEQERASAASLEAMRGSDLGRHVLKGSGYDQRDR
ncbi:hypothetical protein Caci_2968 [Catenulispora acidiphila DSM 44928]|uniref:Uncharacterized protein n=1 Tax=Catenulispora acidiphila (strain DSM 44928 / JCM 14897 / NBRC 102108 / NRRL B-24433 / ID139908) TaxID=479433 RepID=C7Q2Y5_CATAD|nr:hypothetical protein [Catenulispora acidiphila]ACU71877.1 hypothetical protein Caci_2968 [Catenulispora acidiphila DSM 44928]